MKKLLSLLLASVLFLSSLAVAPLSAAAEAAFREGDVLYLKIENPAEWATISNAQLYVNFTDATRAENGNASVVIADADKSRYDPVGGVRSAGANLYQYTVTAADAGKTVMRFWRGNTEKLWNESVAIHAADLEDGNNTAVVTDWSDTGYLTSTYDEALHTVLTLSAVKGDVGDSFEISVTHDEIPGAQISCQILIDDKAVSDSTAYTFTPTEDGVYRVKAIVTAMKNGVIAARETKTASVTVGTPPVAVLERDNLYAHASNGSKDREAWVKWYKVKDVYYFFLPSSCKAFDAVELYSTLYDDAMLETERIAANSVTCVNAVPGKTYRLIIGNEDNYKNVVFLFSSAEAALWVNNTDSFDGYPDFFAYLKADKENSVAATGAFSRPDGTVTNADVKKMKGRGNTSWNADKKGFNLTLKDTIELMGMPKCKKFSLVSNFQDATMARNRILFDLSDQVGVPYASDSRFIDLYTNGVYQGTYQLCQKIEVGKNSLISEFNEDDYLNADTGGVKQDFSFVAEIDSSPAADDFHFTVRNGNNLTMKAPELASDDPNRNAVRSYITEKYNAMYDHLQQEDIGDYLDIPSMAKVYLINELGKNWDAGASSFYFTYKPDQNGRYKFFASPVWDYDNSLGNARGVENDLRRLGITDYTLPTGWFASKKNGYNGPNVLAESVKNSLIMNEVCRSWFEEFVPAIDLLNKENVRTGELWSADVYADILRDSAGMNYKIWELITNSAWICDHSSLTTFTASYTRNKYGQIIDVVLLRGNITQSYDQYTFDGQFDYMMDWLNSRAAWISAQYISGYHPREPEILLGDVDFNGEVDSPDAALIMRHEALILTLSDLQKAAGDVNRDDDCDIIDATLIQRYLVGVIDHLG